MALLNRSKKTDKSARSGKSGATKAADKKGRLKQLAQSYQMTKRSDPRIGPILLGVFLAGAVVGFVVFSLMPGPWPFSVVGAVLLGLLLALIVFGRRAQRAAYAQMEGKPGAAAAVLGQLKRGWKTDTAVAFNKSQDVVHRVVGPPGIVLVGEGNPNRLTTLLSNERRKHERVASETTVHEMVVGNGEGAVPLKKVNRHVKKLKKTQKPAEMTDVLNRLKAIDANRSSVPLPKGPVPTNLKGARQNIRGR